MITWTRFCYLLRIKKTGNRVHKYSGPLLYTLWQTFGSNYCLKSFWIGLCCHKFGMYFWAVLTIPLCRTSQAPSGSMGGIGAQPFSDVSLDVQVWALPGPLKDINRAVLRPLIWDFGFLGLGLLSCWRMKCCPSLGSTVQIYKFPNASQSQHIGACISDLIRHRSESGQI